MCGINGFNFKDESLICKMNQSLSHRGPDDSGIFFDKEISLGHQRLSIIDLSKKGHQPMQSEDGKFTIVFNGEIYNFLEIKEKLKIKYNFISNTDTEVVLYAYREYGPDCLKLFNGIFAFAIWDKEKKALFLARDRNGIKPLYYYNKEGRFVFSSEIKAILEHNVIKKGMEGVCPLALNLYLKMLYVPAPLTMFKGIKKLLPGHFAYFRNNNLEIRKYWDIEDYDNFKYKKNTEIEIKRIIKDAVRKQLISDRPVGIFLSGGIDSTSILGLVREINPSIAKTYSVGFDVDIQTERYNADLNLARKTAEYYGTDHHEIKVSGRDVLENIEDIVWHMDEPVANSTMIAQYLLAKEAKKEVAVVLGGDGGDELFGGYSRYYLSNLVSFYQNLPNFLRNLVEKILIMFKKDKIVEKLVKKPGVERFLAFHSQKDRVLSRILNPNIFRESSVADFFSENYFNFNNLDIFSYSRHLRDFEKYFMNVDRSSWLVDESLLRTDKMTMAHGLEQRVPILDHRLVEIANKIPTKWKINLFSRERGKDIWISAIKKYLPEFILEEKKRGWFSPMSKWLRTDLANFARARVNELDENIFNKKEIKEMLESHINSKKHDPEKYNLNILWALITWQIWYNKFMK